MIFDKFKAMIFDFDGTLADSLDVWADIDIKFAQKRGLVLPEDYFVHVSTMNFPDAAVYTKEVYGLSEAPEEIVKEWSDMAIREYSENVRLKENAAEFVRKIRSLGKKTAIATASEKELVFPCLENNGASQLFDVFSPTSAVKRAKGFPDVYDHAAGLLGVSPDECAVIEDIPAGIKGAKDGGYFTIAMYDRHSIKDMDNLKRDADIFVMNFKELIDML